MKYSAELPKINTVDGELKEVYTHPSFGLISRSVVQGKTNLFGTHISDGGFVEIEINTAELTHRVSKDWYFGNDPVLVLRMSTTQWANFISKHNSSGTPCTFKGMREGAFKRVPDIEGSYNLREKVETDINRMTQDALTKILAGIKSLEDLAESKGSISKPSLREAVRNIKIQTENLPSNLQFCVTTAMEELEKIGDEVTLNTQAKIEQFAESKRVETSSLDMLKIDFKDSSV